MVFTLEKQIDGEWYEWGRYGVSEIHALVEAAWQFGKMGIPVRVTETQVKQKDKFWLWREGEEDA